MKKIALLGSTGSIGTQVLKVVDRYPNKFKIVSLCCNNNAKLLQEQAQKYKPEVIGLTNSEKTNEISSLPNGTTLYTGEHALMHCVLEQADIVVVAVVGFCGLESVIQACKMGKVVALANKESLVAGGRLITDLAHKHGATIIPIDSEHSAIWQCLHHNAKTPFKKIVLTASGGALRNIPLEELDSVTPERALKHPTWKMGAKITIDCATMMNKGLEVIEAMWLFNCTANDIQVVIHPQSIVHSMVEFADNALIAQLSTPSMDIPIQLALSYPERLISDTKPLDFSLLSLDFSSPDFDRYPCLKLALEVAKQGKNLPCALSGANEEAVNLFLNEKIKFTQIAKYIEYALSASEICEPTYENLVKTDRAARNAVLRAYKENKID